MTTLRNSIQYKNLTLYDACGFAEGWLETKSKKQVLASWQYLIDTGVVWKLQGWFGKQASHLIESGIIDEAIKKQ